MLKIENLSKSYGSQILFEGVTVNINKGERVGLVGRNGHGKTTLLRLIAGEETPDEGNISIPKGYRVGHLRQRLHFDRPTILEEVASGIPEKRTWQAEKVLAGLGFSREDLKRAASSFSGGYQVRLNLARLLVSGADILLLDEPTNYLDVVAIRWLERFFLSWKGELLLVTHDRSFMDAVSTHTMGIHRRRIRKIKGNTGKYYSQIAQEEEVHERSRLNLERKQRQTEEFIRKFRAKARLVGLVQSRIKTLEKQKVPERLEAIRTLDFSFRPEFFSGKVMLETEELAFRWSSRVPDLFRNLSLMVGKGDRIAVVGPNGKGKTTLLRVLAGELTRSSGELKVHDRTRIGFFGQTNVQRLEHARTVVEELVAADPDRSLQRARAVAGIMKFEGDLALKKIGVLSGGERSRVLLGRLLLEPHNLLFLDEPTNHLDMDSAEALLEALEDFEEAVIIVTHNEMFLHRLAQRLVVFDRGQAIVFEGSYNQFLSEVGWSSEEEPKPEEDPRSPPEAGIRHERKHARRKRAQLIQHRSRQIGPLKDKAAQLERRIGDLESRIDETNSLMMDASAKGHGQRIAELSQVLHRLNIDVEAGYRELLAVSEKLDKVKEEWAEKIGES
jgi:ATP-binding cassette subfamily F protein 3